MARHTKGIGIAGIVACSYLTVMLLCAGIAAACEGEPPPKCGFEKPSVTTEAATSITAGSAVLNGKVNPNACETSYQFEWGKTESYGSSSGGSAGSGTSYVSKEQFVGGTRGTTYHFRISATNINGTSYGEDKTYTILHEKPSVSTGSATSVTESGATLHGTVNPEGQNSVYYFEYGLSKEYGANSKEKVTTSTDSNESVEIGIAELEPESAYHYRVVAYNNKGTVKGADKTFTTAAAAAATWEVDETPSPEGAKSSRLTFGSCTASSACSSVGSYVDSEEVRVPLAERWNGSSWSAQSPPSPEAATWSDLLGVSCASSSWCTAVGRYESSGSLKSLAMAWNGSEWSLQTAATPMGATSSELSAVSCTSSSACTAVGRYTLEGTSVTLAQRWNGSSWTVQSTPNPAGATSSSLLGVSCTASNACTAVGYYYDSEGQRLTLAESWNGMEWSIQSTPNREGATKHILLGVDCWSASACTAVGGDFPSGEPQETLVERWNGSEWTIQESQNPSESEASVLHGISCVSESACTTVGDYIEGGVNVTLAERWNGSSWALESTPNPEGATFSALWSVACTSTTECIAPGYYKNESGTELALTESSS